MPHAQTDTMTLAVFGLHLTGQPLNRQLTDLGAIFLRADCTAPEYRLYVITNSGPTKPGAIRVTDGSGAAIALELWEIPIATWAIFSGKFRHPWALGR